MAIDLVHYTPVASLKGGVLIGLGISIPLIFNGRTAGVSGIVSNLVSNYFKDGIWRIAFLLGLVISPLAWRYFSDPIEVNIQTSNNLLVASGLLVGLGTSLALGCTSGHGIIGLANLSKRSVVATLTFISTAFFSFYLIHHVWSL